MKVIAIIQARMGSTRLPGKIMKEILGKPLLEYQIERVRKSRLINQIVIATTTKETEQPIIDLCKRLAVNYYRGSEADVLSRYYEAANHYQADVIVRLTSDDPLVDPDIIDKAILQYMSHNNKYDYVSNSTLRTYPLGLDVEVFSLNALEIAHREAVSSAHREHVTPYIYLHPNKFNLGSITHDTDLSSIRLTVDTHEDFTFMERLIEGLYKKKQEHFILEDIIKLLQQNPKWLQLNAHIQQNKIEDDK
ncbi:NTP transferase domain-containing protein [bacterium LRH843]|nr:NTP transferase domain-containing protein [bacterium LRH843]